MNWQAIGSTLLGGLGVFVKIVVLGTLFVYAMQGLGVIELPQ